LSKLTPPGTKVYPSRRSLAPLMVCCGIAFFIPDARSQHAISGEIREAGARDSAIFSELAAKEALHPAPLQPSRERPILRVSKHTHTLPIPRSAFLKAKSSPGSGRGDLMPAAPRVRPKSAPMLNESPATAA